MGAARWMALAALLSLPSPSAAAESARPQDAKAVTRAVRTIFRQHADHDARVEGVSALFMGARYLLSPLGEGDGAPIDDDPLVRYDAFDCVTYVEQVMALSWQPSHRQSSRQLQRIRYAHGEVDYAKRNHIMMAQWIPQNIAAGFVVDITRQVAKTKTRQATLRLDHAAFESSDGQLLKFARAERPLGSFSVPIVPLENMRALVAKLPHGTIVTSIREARTGRPYRASHVGLVVVRDGVRLIRHAHAPSKKLIEQPFSQFVERSQRFRKWPVTGFNLLKIAARPNDHSPPKDASK